MTVEAGGPRMGLVLGSSTPPEQLPRLAKLGEDVGFTELWLAEDYFFTGGISGAASALAATERIPVGLGIVSGLVRHPALLAMEVTTLARIYPGRLIVGLGLGVPDWMRQMGLSTKSPLTSMRECITALRALLAGKELTRQGDFFNFAGIKLAHPPTDRLPIYMGAVGPKMLQLSGEIADGNVLSVLASTEYVRWARKQIGKGAERTWRRGHRSVASFALFSVDHDAGRAKEALRTPMSFYLAGGGQNALTDSYGISEQLTDMVNRGGPGIVAEEMPDRWLDDLVIAGEPDECTERIRAYHDAGADSVVLFAMPEERSEEIIELAAKEVLPRFL
jgi:alkanesulfonate monooxygenase SsuD/methylene tetrahydromethanopterin reductase-like flavin-dependent oxidoreductase (luciferase family)